MPVYAFADAIPRIDPEAFVHPDAVVIGDVVIGALASVWPGAVLRGDYGSIEVGERSSIQDGTVVHTRTSQPTRVGADCVVGHLVHLEGATIEDCVLVGSGAVVLGATVRTGAVVAAGAVVPDGFEIEAGMRAQGVPARTVPNTMPLESILEGARTYVELGRRYRLELRLATGD
jgi:carbonic anhydrase/acetyltransferase-like protein (isoleucine patch superfamily)